MFVCGVRPIGCGSSATADQRASQNRGAILNWMDNSNPRSIDEIINSIDRSFESRALAGLGCQLSAAKRTSRDAVGRNGRVTSIETSRSYLLWCVLHNSTTTRHPPPTRHNRLTMDATSPYRSIHSPHSLGFVAHRLLLLRLRHQSTDRAIMSAIAATPALVTPCSTYRGKDD